MPQALKPQTLQPEIPNPKAHLNLGVDANRETSSGLSELRECNSKAHTTNPSAGDGIELSPRCASALRVPVPSRRIMGLSK